MGGLLSRMPVAARCSGPLGCAQSLRARCRRPSDSPTQLLEDVNHAVAVVAGVVCRVAQIRVRNDDVAALRRVAEPRRLLALIADALIRHFYFPPRWPSSCAAASVPPPAPAASQFLASSVSLSPLRVAACSAPWGKLGYRSNSNELTWCSQT